MNRQINTELNTEYTAKNTYKYTDKKNTFPSLRNFSFNYRRRRIVTINRCVLIAVV